MRCTFLFVFALTATALGQTPSFTAIIPAGRSVSPITKTNWEGTGVTPDIKSSAELSLGVAHMHALKTLLEKETEPQWKQTL